MSVHEAVDLYTRCGAYTTRREHDLGHLLPGYQADFVIIDAPEDVVKHPEYLLVAKPAEVWVAAKQKL